MNKIKRFVWEPIRVFRIIYTILVLTVAPVFQSKQFKLYSTVFAEAALLILIAYSMYWFLIFGCALDNNCAAAQGY